MSRKKSVKGGALLDESAMAVLFRGAGSSALMATLITLQGQGVTVGVALSSTRLLYEKAAGAANSEQALGQIDAIFRDMAMIGATRDDLRAAALMRSSDSAAALTAAQAINRGMRVLTARPERYAGFDVEIEKV